MIQQNKHSLNNNIMRDDRFDEASSFELDREAKRIEFQKEQASKLGNAAIYAGPGRHIDYSRPVDAEPHRAIEVPER